jgi:uncharacterized protein (DUF934 family)
MSLDDTQTPPIARLWRPGGFVDDVWTRVETADAIGPAARVIVPAAALEGVDAALLADGRVGVHLTPAEAVDAIAPWLDRLALISLGFPAFNDGRSYSKAELLRRRHGYRGTIRASGDVLIDQISLMLRTGFDEFEVSNPTAIARLEQGRPGGLPYHYQPTARPARQAGRYSWRRLGQTETAPD